MDSAGSARPSETLSARAQISRWTRQAGRRCKNRRRFRATTNANHRLPVAPNRLERQTWPAISRCSVWTKSMALCWWPGSWRISLTPSNSWPASTPSNSPTPSFSPGVCCPPKPCKPPGAPCNRRSHWADLCPHRGQLLLAGFGDPGLAGAARLRPCLPRNSSIQFVHGQLRQNEAPNQPC